MPTTKKRKVRKSVPVIHIHLALSSRATDLVVDAIRYYIDYSDRVTNDEEAILLDVAKDIETTTREAK